MAIKSSSTQSLIYWSLGLFCASIGVGYLSFQGIIRSPMSNEQKDLASISSRDPASVKDLHLSQLGQSPSQEENIHFDCELKENISVHQAQVRMNLKLCKQDRNVDHLEIVNETNGFTASTFSLSDRMYTTDFVALNPGMNKIKLVLKVKNEIVREEVVSVQRESSRETASEQ